MSTTSACDSEFSTVTQPANVSNSATAPRRARFNRFPKFVPPFKHVRFKSFSRPRLHELAQSSSCVQLTAALP
jgi:hypothetical protein